MSPQHLPFPSSCVFSHQDQTQFHFILLQAPRTHEYCALSMRPGSQGRTCLTYRYCPYEKLDSNEGPLNSSLLSHKYYFLSPLRRLSVDSSLGTRWGLERMNSL